ncbi:MAG: hypothetical protein IBJ11_00545 [Phycisphaerales bacterium]|nr:hypothetical protein [Phycisphaerales bacterium]
MAALAAGLFAAPGCSAPERRADARSIDPTERTMFMARALQSRDPGDIDHLISLLGSSDPAIRMLAIGTLTERTGQTHGYDFAAPDDERALAIERWRRWARERSGSGPDKGDGSAEGRPSGRSEPGTFRGSAGSGVGSPKKPQTVNPMPEADPSPSRALRG